MDTDKDKDTVKDLDKAADTDKEKDRDMELKYFCYMLHIHTALNVVPIVPCGFLVTNQAQVPNGATNLKHRFPMRTMICRF